MPSTKDISQQTYFQLPKKSIEFYFDRNVILQKYLFTLLFSVKGQSEILVVFQNII